MQGFKGDNYDISNDDFQQKVITFDNFSTINPEIPDFEKINLIIQKLQSLPNQKLLFELLIYKLEVFQQEAVKNNEIFHSISKKFCIPINQEIQKLSNTIDNLFKNCLKFISQPGNYDKINNSLQDISNSLNYFDKIYRAVFQQIPEVQAFEFKIQLQPFITINSQIEFLPHQLKQKQTLNNIIDNFTGELPLIFWAFYLKDSYITSFDQFSQALSRLIELHFSQEIILTQQISEKIKEILNFYIEIDSEKVNDFFKQFWVYLYKNAYSPNFFLNYQHPSQQQSQSIYLVNQQSKSNLSGYSKILEPQENMIQQPFLHNQPNQPQNQFITSEIPSQNQQQFSNIIIKQQPNYSPIQSQLYEQNVIKPQYQYQQQQQTDLSPQNFPQQMNYEYSVQQNVIKPTYSPSQSSEQHNFIDQKLIQQPQQQISSQHYEQIYISPKAVYQPQSQNKVLLLKVIKTANYSYLRANFDILEIDPFKGYKLTKNSQRQDKKTLFGRYHNNPNLPHVNDIEFDPRDNQTSKTQFQIVYNEPQNKYQIICTSTSNATCLKINQKGIPLVNDSLFYVGNFVKEGSNQFAVAKIQAITFDTQNKYKYQEMISFQEMNQRMLNNPEDFNTLKKQKISQVQGQSEFDTINKQLISSQKQPQKTNEFDTINKQLISSKNTSYGQKSGTQSQLIIGSKITIFDYNKEEEFSFDTIQSNKTIFTFGNYQADYQINDQYLSPKHCSFIWDHANLQWRLNEPVKTHEGTYYSLKTSKQDFKFLVSDPYDLENEMIIASQNTLFEVAFR